MVELDEIRDILATYVQNVPMELQICKTDNWVVISLPR